MVFSSISAVFGGVFLVVTMFCGVIGNLLIVWIIRHSSKFKGIGHTLLANLAVADALQSCNTFFMFVTVVHRGQWIFGNTACQITAFLTVEFVLASMLSLTVISVNRYYKVLNPERYDKIFTAKSVRIIIAFIWMFPLAYAVPPLVGWSTYVFNPGKCLCLFKFRLNHSYAFFLVGTITTPALLIICYAYFRIFQAVTLHRNRITSLHRGQNRLSPDHESKITSAIAAVVISYIVCFIPATVVNFIEIFSPDYEIPVWLDFSSFVLIFMSHANNPIIYGFLSKQYRAAILNILLIGSQDQGPWNREAQRRGLDIQRHLGTALLVAPHVLQVLNNTRQGNRKISAT